jgi:hypothetical protein
MASKEPKISKHSAAVLMTDITFKISETCNIIRKPGVLHARVSLGQHTNWTVEQLGIKNTRKKLHVTISVNSGAV